MCEFPINVRLGQKSLTEIVKNYRIIFDCKKVSKKRPQEFSKFLEGRLLALPTYIIVNGMNAELQHMYFHTVTLLHN